MDEFRRWDFRVVTREAGWRRYGVEWEEEHPHKWVDGTQLRTFRRREDAERWVEKQVAKQERREALSTWQ